MEEPTIPVPLTEKIPIDVVVRMPEEFNNFVHEEAILGRESWTINLGHSNAVFFEQLFGYLFNNVRLIGPEDDVRDFNDAVIADTRVDASMISVGDGLLLARKR